MNAQPHASAPTSGYRRSLRVASLISVCVAVLAISLALVANEDADWLISLQRSTLYKQWTGYTALLLLAAGLCLSVFKRHANAGWQRPLQLAHRYMGTLMAVLVIAHAGLYARGFLAWLLWLTISSAVLGALVNFYPGKRQASWGQLTVAVHILTGCIMAGLAIIHVYFVYQYRA